MKIAGEDAEEEALSYPIHRNARQYDHRGKQNIMELPHNQAIQKK